MNKLNLVERLRKEQGLPKTEAEKIVDLFFGEITNAFVSGDRVEIRGLCSFYVKQYGEYKGRNSKTGEKVSVALKRLPFFKCGKDLKRRVDY